MKKLCVLAVCAVAVVGFAHSSADAIPPFQKVFYAEYLDNSDNAEFVAAVKEVKCNLCHDPDSKSKKDRNPYGDALSKLLDKKEDKDNTEKVVASLKTVSEAKSPSGATFGELIKSGKLPGAK